MNTLTLSSKPAPPITPTVVQRLRKYVKIMRVSLGERLTYRFDFILSTFLRFLPMVTTILLWRAVFVGKTTIANFDEHEMIAYLLLVHIGRMFSSMPGLAAGIARDIREGSLKKYLLQPIDMLAYLVVIAWLTRSPYIVTLRSALWHPVLSLPRLLRSLSGCPDVAGLSGLALDGIRGRFLLRSLHRHGRLLVSGSHLVSLRHQYRQLLYFRADVPTRSSAPLLERAAQGAAVPVHGLFPDDDFLGQDPRHGSRLRLAGRVRVGGRIHDHRPGALQIRVQAL